MDERGDERDIADFDERVCRGLEEDHFDFTLVGGVGEDRGEGGGGVGGVDVVHDDGGVGGQVFQQPVGAAVEVVAGDDVVPGGEHAGDYVHGGHAGGDDEAAVGLGDFGKVPFEMAACGVAGPGVVVGAVDGVRRALFECCGL